MRQYLINSLLALNFLSITTIYSQSDTLQFTIDELNTKPLSIGYSYYSDEFNEFENDLIRFINENFIYPAELLNSDTFGILEVSWIVEKDSIISAAKILKDIGYGSGAELLRVLNQAVEENFKYVSPLLKKSERVLVKRKFEFRKGILIPTKIPTFDSGDQAFKKLIFDRLKYPAEAKAEGINCSVTVSWIVNSNGEMILPEVIKDSGYGCGAEIIRVIHSITQSKIHWNPPIARYKPNYVKFTKVINFTEEMLNRP